MSGRTAARTLVLLRHSKSDWSADGDDIARPLARRGRRQAAIAGAWLAGATETIDLAVISTATRARDTWELAAAELADPPPIRIEPRCYAATANELLALVRELPETARTVVLVGHNPGIEDLVALITLRRVPMPTSALAVIGWRGPWSAAGAVPATLRAAGRPPAPYTPPSE